MRGRGLLRIYLLKASYLQPSLVAPGSPLTHLCNPLRNRTKKKCEYAKLMIDAEVESLCFPDGGYTPNVMDPDARLDLESLESVKKWSDEVKSSLPYVSHLALNAGIMSVPLNPRNPSTGLEPQIHTNHVAHHYLTSLLLPSLRSTPPLISRRVVTVSSLAAHTPLSYDGKDLNWNTRHHDTLKAYGQSKRANLLFAQSLHDKLGAYGILSLASHPGYSRTNLFSNNWHFAPAWLKDLATRNPVLSMSSEEGSLMSVRSLYDETLGSGCYVTPAVWAVGPPVASCPKERKGFRGWGGEGEVVYPFLGSVAGKIWGGWEWKKNDVEVLEKWTVGVTGSEIK